MIQYMGRKYKIFPSYNQLKIIKQLLYNKTYYEFYNLNNIFFLDEYHEFIRIPQLGNVRISDHYIRPKKELTIIRVRLFRDDNEYLNKLIKLADEENKEKQSSNNNIDNIEEFKRIRGEYYLMIDYIINKDDEMIIDILTNIHKKRKRDITLGDIDRVYNTKIEDLEKNVETVKKKMEKLSTHSKFYWKMQKQLSKKEMKLMNAKMNKYEDILKCEEESKMSNINNIFGITKSPNVSPQLPSSQNNFINNVVNKEKIEIVYIVDKNKPKQDIVFIDKNRKYKDINKDINNRISNI